MRLRFGGRPKIDLEKGDRLIAHGTATDGQVVAATLRQLVLPGDVRIPWQEIDRAQWEDDRSLRIVTSDGSIHEVTLSAEGHLPEVVRERVKASIVAEQLVRLDKTHRVRIVARRIPGDDRITWTFKFDPAEGADDPGLQAVAEQALEGIRRQLGV